jgi:hypothetical protein
MKFRTLATLALALALPFVAVACGGGEDDTDSGERPTADELITAYKADPNAAAYSDEFIACMANGLIDSKLPNGVVRALAEGRDASVDEGNLDDYEKILENIQIECSSQNMGGEMLDTES